MYYDYKQKCDGSTKYDEYINKMIYKSMMICEKEYDKRLGD